MRHAIESSSPWATERRVIDGVERKVSVNTGHIVE